MIKFSYNNGFVKGSSNKETAEMLVTLNKKLLSKGLDIITHTNELNGDMCFKADVNLLPLMADAIKEEKLKDIKQKCIAEWKRIHLLAIPETPINKIVEIVKSFDDIAIGYVLDDEYLDIAMPHSTITILVNNNKVDSVSRFIEVFDGYKKVSDNTEIYLNDNGELDAKIN